MPTITGTLKDSGGTAMAGRLNLAASAVAAFEDSLRLKESNLLVATSGAVSIAPASGGLTVPQTTLTCRVYDADGELRHTGAAVTVTQAMDTLDEVL